MFRDCHIRTFIIPKMKKLFLLTIIFYNIISTASAQRIPLPGNLPQYHPRLMTSASSRPELRSIIENEEWAGNIYDGILNRIDPYVEKTQDQPDWLFSRFMMYWKSKSCNVYIKGGVYSHADGDAPVPTVRFGSTRGVSSQFRRPKIDDIIPYMDDTKGIFFHNCAKEGNPLEWGDPSGVSGMHIEGINNEILRIGRDGAFIYWITEDEKYGKFAYDLFDTYMTGLYYRNEPIDLNNGHANTLAGLTTFEVIQEGIISDVAAYYDFLHSYIQKNHRDKIPLYEGALKKWIDLTIKNGVPHNNWNLHQANIILTAAMVLEDNSHYEDGKGREYYIDFILNNNSPRQWSMSRLQEYGYDFKTGIWNECPGYAQSVTREFMHFIRRYDNTFNQNLLPFMPVMNKAVEVLPQYLFPNNLACAFGDTYYSGLSTDAMKEIIALSQKYGDREREEEYTRMYRLFNPEIKEEKTDYSRLPHQVASFFTGKPLVLDPAIAAGEIKDYITPTFYAPNVSWFVQRNKFEDRQNALMVSTCGSYGNHAHANGISIELYGKGYILGAESGIGSSYFEKPYLEYYSQFPAHNTVMVDGISKYPEMLSNHPFDLIASYPQSGQKEGYYPGLTYSSVYFLEPESRSDQTRLTGIVRTGETTGYYVDIFRSKRQRGNDKFHDYFYHNLGKEMIIEDISGNPLELNPSGEMAFAGGHLFAMDYMWDKKSAMTDNDYQIRWKMDMPDNDNVYMNLWMKGYPGREIFSIKAPSCKAFRGDHRIPYDVYKEPYLTISARQHGEAWNKPFVGIFEPYTENEGRSVVSVESFDAETLCESFVGLIVTSRNGRKDYIFSTDNNVKSVYKDMETDAVYAVVTEQENDFSLFLGNGKSLKAKGFSILSEENCNAVLEYKNGEFYLSADKPVTVKIAGKRKKFNIEKRDYEKISFR